MSPPRDAAVIEDAGSRVVASDGTTRVPAADRREPPKPAIEIEDAATPRGRTIIRSRPRDRRADAGDLVNDARRITEDGARAANERAQVATRDAQTARAETGRAVELLVSERVSGAKGRLEAAKSAKTSATSQLRTAREAGDFEAEQKAIEDITQSTYNINRATEELASAESERERIKTAKPAPGADDGAGKPSPAAQAWIDSHPLINAQTPEGDEYFAAASAADALAVRRGHVRGSQAYVDFVDQTLEDQFGENHGEIEPRGRSSRDRANSQFGAPRGGGGSRGASGDDGTHLGGANVVVTPLGRIGYRQGADGKPIITFPNAETRADFQAGADACSMSLGEYALDQVKIAEETASGRNAGLFVEDDTVVMR